MPEPWTVLACKDCGGILDEHDGAYHHRYGTDRDACVSVGTWLAHEDAREVEVLPHAKVAEVEVEVERLRKRSHEIATAKDREMASLQSQVDRYRHAFAQAREVIKDFRADWTTDPPSQEEDGFWRYTSEVTREAMGAVMLAANERELKYRKRAQDAEDKAFFAERAYKALAREAADLLGERAPGAAAMFDQAAEEGLMDMVGVPKLPDGEKRG